MFVKPAPGLKVRDPISRLHLPETGKEVPESTYWMRRLAAKDVVPAKALKSAPATAAPASAATTAAPKKE